MCIEILLKQIMKNTEENITIEIIKRFLKQHTTHRLETLKLMTGVQCDFICEVYDQSGSIQKISFWLDSSKLYFGKGDEKFSHVLLQ